MNCPQCNEKLARIKYKGANAQQCLSCNGILIDKTRASRIEKRVNKDVAQLAKEAERSESVDVQEEIRCPACRNRMAKVLVKELLFHVDECSNCDKAWFDGGEIAKIQLAFENKEQTIELNQMRTRLQNMSEAEKASYEKRIAELTDLGTPMEQAISESVLELSAFYYWRM
jgi:Zn-finger nucleic acid-binding protein